VRLKRIKYAGLTARQRENFNFQKLSAVLADYGFTTLRLSDDWDGADFIAVSVGGTEVLRVQLKGRLTFRKAYRGKNLFIAFPDGQDWLVFPHDEVLEEILAHSSVKDTVSWSTHGGYSWPRVPKKYRELLEPYRITGDVRAIPE
jgi:hypothetical protein